MKHINQEDIQLRNRLNDICLLRLFRNTKKEFGDYIEFNLNNNNSILKIKPFTARCLYRELEKQISQDTYTDLDINELLNEYKVASALYVREIKKLHINPETDIDLLYAYLRYVCINELEVPECNDKKLNKLINGVNTYPQVRLVPLLLIMLKILPIYTSKQGDVKDINADFTKLYHFFAGFARKELSILEMPVLEIMKHYFIQRHHKNRIMLIHMACCAINSFCSMMNSADSYDLVTHINNNTQLPDIGKYYWYDTAHYNDTTTFWDFEQTATGDYFLYKYKFKLDLQETHRIKYDITFFIQWNTLILYAAKSSYIYHLLKEKKHVQTDKQAWYKYKMDNEQSPQKIEIYELMAGKDILSFKFLSRLTNENMTEQVNNWKERFRTIDIKDENEIAEREDYIFLSAPIAITKNYIFVKQEIGEKEAEITCYYQVPKEINEGLNKISINDFVGILTTNNRKYVGFSPISLYLDITNDEAMKESKVELVDKITIF